MTILLCHGLGVINYLSFSQNVIQQSPPIIPEYSDKEKAAYYATITELLQSGAVSICEPCAGQYLSSIFLIQKPNGKYRFILNLQNLNKHIDITFQIRGFLHCYKINN